MPIKIAFTSQIKGENDSTWPLSQQLQRPSPSDSTSQATTWPCSRSSRRACSRAYIQRSMEGDLADIPGAFIVPGGKFWVATAIDNTREAIVGMVALEKKTDDVGELRRMSVKQEFRGLGVGKLLVLELEQWARANGFANVTLSTGQVMLPAQKSYLSVGFAQRETVVVCVDPYYADVLFVKRLS